MDPVTIALLASAGSAAIKGISGAAQKAKGKRMSRGARPQEEISSADTEYLNNARAAAASSQLPGQDIIDQKIRGASATGYRRAQEGANSSAGLMAGIAGIAGNEQEAHAETGIAGAQMQASNKDKLQAALLKYGSDQKEVFDYNKSQPYYEKATAAQALKGAGDQNLMNGAEGLLSAASIGATNASSKEVTPGTTGTNPFGMSSATQQLGMKNQNNTLGMQSNTQKFLNAQRRGFVGDYNAWMSKQSLGSGLNFQMQ